MNTSVRASARSSDEVLARSSALAGVFGSIGWDMMDEADAGEGKHSVELIKEEFSFCKKSCGREKPSVEPDC